MGKNYIDRPICYIYGELTVIMKSMRTGEKLMLDELSGIHLLVLLPLKLRRKALKYNLGAAGMKYLEDALNGGFAKEVNGYISGQEYGFNSEEDLIRANELALELLSESGYDDRYNSFAFDTFLGNKKAAIRLRCAYRKLIEEIDNIRNSSDCEGKQVFLAGLYMAKIKTEDN